MKARLAAHLESIIDSICRQGCQQVRQFIKQLRQGHVDERTESLNNRERKLVLTELESIMAVYDHQ